LLGQACEHPWPTLYPHSLAYGPLYTASKRTERGNCNGSVNTFPGQRPPKELYGPPQSYIRSANRRSRGNGLRADQTEKTTCLLSLQCNSLRTDQKRTPKEKALLCRCPATGAVIQFFQKCKWSWNEQNHGGKCGNDSFTVRTHQTHIQAEKQSYIRSKDGHGPSDKNLICPATGPRNGPQRKIQPIVVPLPSNIGPLANYTDRVSEQVVGPLANYADRASKWTNKQTFDFIYYIYIYIYR
jgi:hypothetical protein